MNLALILGAGILSFFIYWIWLINKPKIALPGKFPEEWKTILNNHVYFYQNLTFNEKLLFERKIFNFLKKVKITGIETTVDDLDRLLIASGAVIPLFAFPDWEYAYLNEVLLYPSAFDRNFSTDEPEENISGMVGSGQNMEGVMILNKQSLHQGFSSIGDIQNTAIHEFVHILDKQDGAIDGIPQILNSREFARPWFNMMYNEMNKIKRGESDIPEYAATSEVEFFAVASEYFFEKPQSFQQNNPELYNTLKHLYQQDMVKRFTKPFRNFQKNGKF